MTSAKAVFLLLSLTHCLADTSRVRGWRGIVPLHSTRADVERLLGTYVNKRECVHSICSYYLDDVIVHFNYSAGDCNSGRGAWDVPLDTVTWITVYSKPRPRLSDLNIDESKFEKRKAIGDTLLYINQEEGVSMEVWQGAVMSFNYGPTAKDEHLRCPAKDQDTIFSDVPEASRTRLLERLNQFVEYSRTEQYEKQYELFLPKLAAKMFPVRNKQEFGKWVRTQEGFRESWIEFKPRSITEIEDDTYGKVYLIYGLAKTSEGGKIVESSRTTKAVIKGGEWYLIDLFRLAPL